MSVRRVTADVPAVLSAVRRPLPAIHALRRHRFDSPSDSPAPSSRERPPRLVAIVFRWADKPRLTRFTAYAPASAILQRRRNEFLLCRKDDFAGDNASRPGAGISPVVPAALSLFATSRVRPAPLLQPTRRPPPGRPHLQRHAATPEARLATRPSVFRSQRRFPSLPACISQKKKSRVPRRPRVGPSSAAQIASSDRETCTPGRVTTQPAIPLFSSALRALAARPGNLSRVYAVCGLTLQSSTSPVLRA